MKFIATVTGLLMLASPGQCTLAQSSNDTVILVHGMGRTKRSMAALASHLSQQGYRVVNFGYPSTRQSIETSREQLRQAVQRETGNCSGQVHFVTHSLGGIVVRALLKEERPDNLGRVVMLSPPNQGSEVVDRLRNNVFYKLATGRAGQQLGTESHSLPNQLGEVDFPVGVIAGSRSFNPLFSIWIEGPSDGKVGVARARVAGMSDFLVVPRSHTYIMRSGGVIKQVSQFLREGRFEHHSA